MWLYQRFRVIEGPITRNVHVFYGCIVVSPIPYHIAVNPNRRLNIITMHACCAVACSYQFPTMQQIGEDLIHVVDELK
jgi:hypothetical protein